MITFLKTICLLIIISFFGLVAIVVWNNWLQIKHGSFDAVESDSLHFRASARGPYLVIGKRDDLYILKKNGHVPSDVLEIFPVPGTTIPIPGHWYNISVYGDKHIFEECETPAIPVWEQGQE